MKLKFVVTAFVAAAALVGCAHAQDEAAKKATESEFRGQWAGPCSTTGFVSSVAGINSSKTLVAVEANQGRTVQLFSDNACKTLIGQATYAGTETVGGPSVAGNGARILDLNYTAVSVQINDASAVSAANTFQTCGINDWKAGQAREVTAHAGDMNCAFTAKPGTVFDIVQIEGNHLYFGAPDATHDKTSEAARPVAIDRSVEYVRQ